MSSAPPSESQVREALRTVIDPGIGRSLADLGMVQSVVQAPGGGVTVRIKLPTPAHPRKDELRTAISAALETDATPPFEEPHATWVVRFWVVPSV